VEELHAAAERGAVGTLIGALAQIGPLVDRFAAGHTGATVIRIDPTPAEVVISVTRPGSSFQAAPEFYRPLTGGATITNPAVMTYLGGVIDRRYGIAALVIISEPDLDEGTIARLRELAVERRVAIALLEPGEGTPAWREI
jgi:hypothetical protein